MRAGIKRPAGRAKASPWLQTSCKEHSIGDSCKKEQRTWFDEIDLHLFLLQFSVSCFKLSMPTSTKFTSEVKQQNESLTPVS